MTITTAKLPRAARFGAPRLAPLAAAAALLAAAPCQAGWVFTPAVGGTETYTDNVSLQSDDRAHSQYVSDLHPGFTLEGRSERVKLSASAVAHQFIFSRGGMPGTSDHQLQYQLDAHAKLADDLLFLDGAASGGPQSVSAFGPQLNNNLYAMGNRAEVRTWRLSPYIRHRFGQAADMTLRYTRDEVDAGRNLLGTSSGQSAAFDLASGPTWNTLGWGMHVNRQQIDSPIAGDSSADSALGNLSLRLGRDLSLTASGGYDRYDYQALGGRTAGKSWTGGFIWSPSLRTRLEASYGRRFFGRTGGLSASHRSRHTVWSINYSDMVTTTRAQFLLPATISTAAMLDHLFAATIPDPVERAQAVAEYMAQAGLPPSLADNINYFSNRWMRQKQLQAAAAFKGSRSTLTLTAFDTSRTALSVQQTDSALLGSTLGTLNDDTRQRGLSALGDYRLSPRSSLVLNATAANVRSLSTGYVDHHRMLRLGLTHRFARKINGMVEVREAHGGLGAGTGKTYREEAVSATLSIQL